MSTPQTLTGTLIGTAGSFQGKGNTIAKAVDGNAADYFDGPTANGCWVGYDLQSQFVITGASFAPRIGNTFVSRLDGGKIQGANKPDFSDAVTLVEILLAPATYTTQPITITTPFRYVRFLSPDGGWGNISRLSFQGTPYVPPAVPTTEIGSSFYANLPYACNDSRLDTGKFPGLLAAARAMKITGVRAWLEYPNLVHIGDSYWNILRGWKKAGFKIGIQYQGFQDQNPKYSMPPKAAYMDAVTRMVASGIVDEIYWANEIDSTSGQVYYNGTLAQMAQMLSDVAPVATSAGILNIGPSFVHGNNYDQKLNAAGIYAHMDAVDQHFYSTEAANQAAMVAWATRAASYGKKCYSTEFGFTGSGQGHATEQQAALNSLRSLGGTYFPWVYIPHPSGYASPLDVNANPINPEYGAWVAGMGG